MRQISGNRLLFKLENDLRRLGCGTDHKGNILEVTLAEAAEEKRRFATAHCRLSTFRKKLERLQGRATNKDDEDAPLQIVKTLTEQEKFLRSLGLRLTGEDGEPQCLATRTPEWFRFSRDCERGPRRLERLFREGDPAAVRKLIRVLAAVAEE